MAQLIGSRVVRGRDWTFQEQDGGDGHLGTVTRVDYDDDRVCIVWDHGKEFWYKASQDIWELRLFDIAPTGILHSDVTCQECKERNIKGVRWLCLICVKCNLCHKCYHEGKHNNKHLFGRIDTPNSHIVKLPKRKDAVVVCAKGLLPGAKVKRGVHWEWRDSDGGSKSEGYLQEICEWGPDSFRDAARVKWSNKNKTFQRYRVGAEGCVDLSYIKEGVGHTFFKEHLPSLVIENYSTCGEDLFKPGDKVQVDLNESELKTVLESLSIEWDSNMVVCVDNIGTIIQVTDDGWHVRVQYQDCSLFTFHKMVLRKVHRFEQGDLVRVMKNRDLIFQLQQGHGGWSNKHGCTLGKLGRVAHIDHDADITVDINEEKLLYSPVCLDLVDPDKCRDREVIPPITDNLSSPKLFDPSALFCGSSSKNNKNRKLTSLVKAADKGCLDDVKELLKCNPSQLNEEENGIAPLQLACKKGHEKVVKYLLEVNADINKVDSDMNSPLHHAVEGKKSAIVKLLLEHHADSALQNKFGQTPLHLAVEKEFPKAITNLVRGDCDVNIKDKEGNTAIHDAIKKDQGNLIENILYSFNIDMGITNAKGYNILQWATAINSAVAVDLILDKFSRDLSVTDMKTSTTGQTALHLAAKSNFKNCAQILILKGKANVNCTDNHRQTPLHIAVTKCHQEIVELLLNYDIDINAKDDKGNTPLHLTQINSQQNAKGGRFSEVKRSEVACLLLEHGANLMIKNESGQTTLDLIPSGPSRIYLKRIAKTVEERKGAMTGVNGGHLPLYWKTMNDKQFLMVTLDKSDPLEKSEFDTIAELLKVKLSNRTMVDVIRIQNKDLWEIYSLKKQQLQRKYGKGHQNEVSLFHGTKSEYAYKICEKNFDIRISGSNVGRLFGVGAYFTTDISLADTYCSDEESDGFRYILYTKVLAGKINYGSKEMQDPSEGYDCTVDDVRKPRIYCIFDNKQLYPEYLLKYR